MIGAFQHFADPSLSLARYQVAFDSCTIRGRLRSRKIGAPLRSLVQLDGFYGYVVIAAWGSKPYGKVTVLVDGRGWPVQVASDFEKHLTSLITHGDAEALGG